ncbi:MAG: UDP-N-acetylmuramoyl-tripeptide--D-alanyl-D-alanine ligase [Clostridia bacterium]|nr:UDP-N-acetylmuramoyl-tripeptide--D-alanyl-D-alanine ligase [Clostridia bacterium]
MIKLTLREIANAVDGKIISGEENIQIDSVSIDSRKIQDNTLFIPLKGENADGHDFIEKAFENNAVAVLTQNNIKPYEGRGIILVKDTAAALGQLAKYYKKKFRIKTAAVTGSVGKTTTKDMLASVLGMQYNTLKTEGNYNNEIGLPLTVLKLNHSHEAAVFELGMSAFGEIKYLADIVRPEVGIITNIGMSHIENLGSQEGIYKAKTEICEYFDKNSLLIVNGDDKYLINAKKFTGFEIITYGIENKECDYLAYDIENLGLDGSRFKTKLYGVEYTVHVKTPGIHNIYNALAAAACGVHYNIGPRKIIEGIENFSLTKMRMSIEKAGSLTVINDCYNSSPDSVNAALKVLSTQNTRRVAVLGDVLEMGEYAKEAHLKMGEAVKLNGIDYLITAGENARFIAEGAKKAGLGEENIISFENTEQAKNNIMKYIKENDSILIKASRGMHFETLTEEIMKNAEEHINE